MSTPFKSMENKGMLWELMTNESPEFKKGVARDFEATRTKFESCITKTCTTLKQTDNLLQLNKQFVSNLTSEFSSTQPILAKDIQTTRAQKLTNEFDSKKREMDSFLKTNKPDEINFSLTSDAPLANVDDVLNKKLAERKYDIATATTENKSNLKDAEAWIGLPSEKNEVVRQSMPSPSLPPDVPNIFNKLKQEPRGSDAHPFIPHQGEDIIGGTDMRQLLMTILENQSKIMTHLEIK